MTEFVVKLVTNN